MRERETGPDVGGGWWQWHGCANDFLPAALAEVGGRGLCSFIYF